MKWAALCALLAGPAHAFCGATGADSAALIAGDWTVSVISAQITVGNVTQEAGPAPDEAAKITFDTQGTGTLTIKAATIPLRQLADGAFHLNGRGARTLAFSKALEHLKQPAGDLPCPLTNLPQYRAENAVAVSGREAVTLTDLIVLNQQLVVGVQSTQVRTSGQPDILIMTNMALRRAAP